MSRIHPTAMIHPGAVIGPDCEIGPWCQIGEDVVLGGGNILHANVIIMGCTRIGAENKIFPHAVIGTDPQDLKYRGAKSGLRIGDRNLIREFVTINRSNQTDELTVVGDDNLLMAYVHVAHNCNIGSGCVISNSAQLAGHVVVGDQASIGGLTAVHQFVHIGTHAFVGGASAVKKDIAPYTRGMGNPYKTVGLNSVGLTRNGFAQDTLAAIKEIYKLFYQSGLNVSQAMAEAAKWHGLTPEQQIFVDFVRAGQRGLSH